MCLTERSLHQGQAAEFSWNGWRRRWNIPLNRGKPDAFKPQWGGRKGTMTPSQPHAATHRPCVGALWHDWKQGIAALLSLSRSIGGRRNCCDPHLLPELWLWHPTRFQAQDRLKIATYNMHCIVRSARSLPVDSPPFALSFVPPSRLTVTLGLLPTRCQRQHATTTSRSSVHAATSTTLLRFDPMPHASFIFPFQVHCLHLLPRRSCPLATNPFVS
jgi:hypothetical protein